MIPSFTLLMWNARQITNGGSRHFGTKLETIIAERKFYPGNYKKHHMKLIIVLFACLTAFTANAQTSKELIGKWKLVKQTKDGVVSEPKDTYQVFMEDGKFQGINGDNSRNGKWKLSDDNKMLSVSISIITVKFTVDYFDADKRTITSGQTGTLEYEKVKE